MPYLLDADWAVHALAGRQDTISTLDRLAPEGLFISWVTVGEVYEGAFGPRPRVALDQIRQFLHSFRTLNLNDPIMERFAAIRSDLRARGQGIPDLDVLAAATALHYDLTLLTSDRHFQRVPGLKIYRPGQ
ncbi:MAG: type II toxin-antitoxin system VapC family toxin [Armatimonadetes bacterium]|nr:type II toxin-antitoxin system VapC family toxin [Armatimonadota bacterium]